MRRKDKNKCFSPNDTSSVYPCGSFEIWKDQVLNKEESLGLRILSQCKNQDPLYPCLEHMEIKASETIGYPKQSAEIYHWVCRIWWVVAAASTLLLTSGHLHCFPLSQIYTRYLEYGWTGKNTWTPTTR